MNDPLTADLAADRVLSASQASFSLTILDETDSTNARMKAWARGEEQQFGNLSLPAVLIADRQTSGRGRLGRAFFSPGGTGLYMSVALPAPPQGAPPLTIAAAVAVCEGLEMHGFAPSVKWVNDVFVHHKKVCGILAEMVAQIVIIGIGINARAPEGGFPEEIRGVAGALGGNIRRDALAGCVAGRLIEWASRITDEELIMEYIRRMPLEGREIAYRREDREFTAVVVGIDRLGGLIVRDANGTESILRSGEITIGSKNIVM